MDENMNNNPQEGQQNAGSDNPANNDNNNNLQQDIKNVGNDVNSGINNLFMGNEGDISNGRNSGAAVATSSRTLLILGWISAALTAFISPYFAIAGIAFGVMANRQVKGSGNAVIVTNIVLAVINLLFGLFLIVALRRMMFGY